MYDRYYKDLCRLTFAEVAKVRDSLKVVEKLTEPNTQHHNMFYQYRSIADDRLIDISQRVIA